MPEPLRIFVSATADLESERAVIGRTLADMPAALTTEIRRYPKTGTSYDTLFELISNVDRVYFLLGQDITAPSGSEWDLAFRLERPLLALRKPAPLTPAADHFLRSNDFLVTPKEWRWFRNDAELAGAIARDITNLLLQPRNRYGLTLVEMDRLRQWRRSFGQTDDAVPSPEPGGAEGGGVILSG